MAMNFDYVTDAFSHVTNLATGLEESDRPLDHRNAPTGHADGAFFWSIEWTVDSASPGRWQVGNPGRVVGLASLNWQRPIRPDDQHTTKRQIARDMDAIMTAIMGRTNSALAKVSVHFLSARPVVASGEWLNGSMTFEISHYYDLEAT
jgi:hypothetical protein